MVSANGERGQLILIGALLVAATILGSITLLNAIHESPEITTQQDSQSLVETERTVAQVQDGLERVFLVNTSVTDVGYRLPYADESSFGAIVEEYDRQYGNLSTAGSAGVVNVTYVGGQQGAVVWQNESLTGFEEFAGSSAPTTIIEDATTVPRLSMRINETTGSDPFNITVAGEEAGSAANVTLRVYDNRIDWERKGPFGTLGPETVCNRAGANEPVELEFVNGTGTITTEKRYCGDIDLGASLDPGLDVWFNNGTNALGTFALSGVDPDVPSSPFSESFRASRDSVLVNPIFEIEYRTPNVEYGSSFGLYNTTGR